MAVEEGAEHIDGSVFRAEDEAGCMGCAPWELR